MLVTNFTILLLVGAGVFFSPSVLAGKEVSDLCDAGDIIFFSCVTKSKKTISLCGKGSKNNPTGAYYRFGRKNKVEMDFPENKDKNSFLRFTKSHYFRYRVSWQAVYFNNNGYSYTLYNDRPMTFIQE